MLSVRRAICEAGGGGRSYQISIHALREEGDSLPLSSGNSNSKFLSTPSARRATSSAGIAARSAAFLSTPSARRATLSHHPPASHIMYFYPRPPRGGRREGLCPRFDDQNISIHALREEGDSRTSPIVSAVSEFLSTPSARRATRINNSVRVKEAISIHALREEGDGTV